MSKAMKLFCYYLCLPIIRKAVGWGDSYNGGRVKKLVFDGEFTVVWVEYAMFSKAYCYNG